MLSSKTPRLRVLVIGAGVIGSVYAGYLANAGHEVAMLARAGRLEDLRRRGLRMQRSGGGMLSPSVTIIGEVPDRSFELVVIAVRREQAISAADQAARTAAGAVLLA